MTEARRRVLEAALAWVGTPYHHHGRVKGVGVDCVHLLCAAYEEAGVMPPFDPGNYPRDWHQHRSEERYLNGLLQAGARQVDEPLPGDVLLWRFGRTYSHAGIYLGQGQAVHACVGVGVIVSGLSEAVFRLRGQLRPRLNFTLEGLDA